MSVFDSLTGNAYNTAYKNNLATINTGLNQQTTALGDNYTQANGYILNQGLPALQAGYGAGLTSLGTGYGNQAIALNAGYNTGQNNLTQYGGQAQDAINAGYTAALGALGSGYGQGRQDLTDQYGQARTDITSNYGTARDDMQRQYQQARDDLVGNYTRTQDYLQPVSNAYSAMAGSTQAGLNRYLNATGANGAAGSAQAAQDFVAAPGYQYALDQATGAVQRSAAARGGLAGGNATADILNTANGLASQGYQQYVNNLQNTAGLYNTALSGQASAAGAQATAAQNYGNQLASTATNFGTQLGNLGTQQGNQLAGISQNLGNALNNNATGLANAQAGQYDSQANALGNLYTGLGSALNASNTGLGTSLGGSYANLGTGQSALNVSNGAGTYGAYGQLGSNLMNLGNQEATAIGNATKMYVDQNNQKAAAQTQASGNLLGSLVGIANSPLVGSIGKGLGGLFS